jgi:hypothetical protein
MDRTERLLAILFGILLGWMLLGNMTFAAEPLKVDGLPDEPRQFRAAVDSVIKKVDTLVEQLRGKADSQAIILDLLQTRDDILREVPKIDASPGDAKWTQKEMRESVQDKLKLLKTQYEKALESTS